MFMKFAAWAETAVRRPRTVLLVMVAGLLILGGYGLDLHDHLSADGWDDPGSQSARETRLKAEVFGHDHVGDVLVIYRAPPGGTIDDPAFAHTVTAALNDLPRRYPGQITKINGSYWPTATGVAMPQVFGDPDHRYAFASIAIAGDDATTALRNYRKVAHAFTIAGVHTEIAGGQPVTAALEDTMARDQRRMELFAVPPVAVLLLFVFGSVLAAALPLIVGGLTIAGAWGIVRGITLISDVNSFVSPVVSMIGLGLAIDYGLFIVSRWREELAAGRDSRDAVRRAVCTAGRTVATSATIVVVAAAGILLFPQGFLRSFAYGAMITVALAAITSLTVLPALLTLLGERVNTWGPRRFRPRAGRPAARNRWGLLAGWVMKRPLAVAIPVLAGLALLILPVHNVALGGISERFLPPDNPARTAQEHFDRLFPLRQIGTVSLIVITDDSAAVDGVLAAADRAPGLAAPFPAAQQGPGHPNVYGTETVLTDAHRAGPAIDHLRGMRLPPGTTLLVGGDPASQRDSVAALKHRMPLMISFVFLATTVLLVASFGSLVLPLQAGALNLLGLGSTLGVLTWIFVDGHGAGVLRFTPQPIMALILVLIVAVIYGLSTDYEVFLLARIAEARADGMPTAEAVRTGIARTGRIITTAALILVVVTGAFALSDLVMMQYVACGMVAALIIDVTVLRLVLVPASMAVLGEASWWAPSWVRPGPGIGRGPVDSTAAEPIVAASPAADR